MFLKRIEINGFKSFADMAIINFDHAVTGVVGPNGCGKSNITDAIKWVLGEQSAKNMRGEKMTDVIFSGSINRKKVNMAEVTLIFDNNKNYLNTEYKDVEITRRIYFNDQPGQYLINRRQVRLKDIQELILDSGIGRDSLSMISQGNISEFAEARPIDRRAIFEEAAGVSKYKKKKLESLNKLIKTKENLERIDDLLVELERQVTPLKRQAQKAIKYREKKAKLEKIEIAVLVNEITNLLNEIDSTNTKLQELDQNNVMANTSIQINENKIADLKKDINSLDNNINLEQERLMSTINEIQALEKQKIELTEKRKYLIEVGNPKEKAEQIKLLLKDAKNEYEARINRLDKFNSELTILTDQLGNLASSIMDKQIIYDNLNSKIRNKENKLVFLKNLIDNPFNNSNNGAKAVIEAKHYLQGIHDLVGKLLHPDPGYEEAIATALGGSVYNIVSEDEKTSKLAISFLKKNKSGRATFLPISTRKARFINKDIETIASNTLGYLGLASDFVSCQEKFELIKGSLLGNILVVDNLNNASNLAALIKYRAKIVTLDGEVVHLGGAITGGKVKKQTSMLTSKVEYDRVKSEIDSLYAKLELAKRELNKVKSKKNDLEGEIQQLRINSAQVEALIDIKKSKYLKLKNEYELISPNIESSHEDSLDDAIVNSLSEAYNKRDELNQSLKTNRENKKLKNNELERIEIQTKQIRKKNNEANLAEKKLLSLKAKCENQMANDINRLASEYQMTYEFAKEKLGDNNVEFDKDQVIKLRNEIASLGNINMEAPEAYSEANERFEFMKRNHDDLINSRNQLLKAIDEMDNVMKSQFLEMFNKINSELSETFTQLFGGGRANLILENPDDLLNTGVDIDVQPPGKSVKSIRLFSGGEKTLIAISVLFTILKVRSVPLVIFDEVEAALDQANVERFAKYVKNFKDDTQFIIVTHRPGTMEQCDVLYGVTMQHLGVSQMMKVELIDAIELAENIKE